MEVVLDDASAILLITIIFVISVSDYGGCNDDLLPIIEQKLKYNAVNQLITKGQQIAI